jgi:hypothetical protein
MALGGSSVYKAAMARIRPMLLSVIAVLALLTPLAFAGSVWACPLNTVVTQPSIHAHGCRHAPAKPIPVNHDGPMCTAVCIGVLPAPMQFAAARFVPVAPLLARLSSLSGIDPGLDPPPPRLA